MFWLRSTSAILFNQGCLSTRRQVMAQLGAQGMGSEGSLKLQMTVCQSLRPIFHFRKLDNTLQVLKNVGYYGQMTKRAGACRKS